MGNKQSAPEAENQQLAQPATTFFGSWDKPVSKAYKERRSSKAGKRATKVMFAEGLHSLVRIVLTH